MNIPITRNLPPDADVREELFECTRCGGYYLGCCDQRDAHAVTYESAWKGVRRWDEWLLLEAGRLISKGCKFAIKEGDGGRLGPEGTVALWAVEKQ